MSSAEQVESHAEETLPNASSGGTEYAPVTDPLLAAFTAGVHFNRLDFFLQQAWFFSGNEIANSALLAASDFGNASGLLVPVVQRPQLREEIVSCVRTLIDRSRSERHRDELEDVRQALCDSDEPCQARANLLESPRADLAGLLARLGPFLDEERRQALDLGRLIDQGLCRSSI